MTLHTTGSAYETSKKRHIIPRALHEMYHTLTRHKPDVMDPSLAGFLCTVWFSHHHRGLFGQPCCLNWISYREFLWMFSEASTISGLRCRLYGSPALHRRRQLI